MLRALGWLGVATLALLARWYDSDSFRVACAFALLALVGLSAPRALRLPLALVTLVAVVLAVESGGGPLFDAMPALIAALVGWIFLRSLRCGRTPLIARAIARLDGAEQLEDPAVARYARVLTWVWAVYQSGLALVAALLAMHAAGRLNWIPAFAPGPRAFGTIVLPLAVVALFLGEFTLRRWLLPQAPRHSLVAFVRDLVRTWPSLLGD
ncbi:MAG: hypothetical protein P4L92_23275 [Rudaea sp.]|nr:hypothetical protein [Rudaea sp.]